MSTTQEETSRTIGKDTPPESDPTEIDRNAPAGTPASWGRRVRDGRLSTDDNVVEAMDEEAPPLAGN